MCGVYFSKHELYVVRKLVRIFLPFLSCSENYEGGPNSHGQPSASRKYYSYITGGIREKGGDKEDLASRNIFLMVALGLCAAVAPA